MIDFRQAQQIILAQAKSFGRETVSLDQAAGRVLAERVRADRDYPPFPRATMDGYALRYSDLERGIRRFRVAGTIFAGSQLASTGGSGFSAGGSGFPAPSLGAAECYRIMTGAAVPLQAGPDILIRRENVEEGGDWIQLLPVLKDPLPAGTLPAPPDPAFPWRSFQNIARQGEDLRAGDIVIDTPCTCDPTVIGLLATLGHTKVNVERLPRVAVLTTGNEVVPADAAVGPVQIRNSNRWSIGAALQKQGISLSAAVHAPDDPARLVAEIKRLLEYDALIICGGVSAGDADFVPGALAAAGVQQLFHKIAMRPGKPVWVGVKPGGPMVFALPGNPFSCLVNMVLLIQPWLRACYGLPFQEPLGFALGVARKKRSPLDEFLPVYLQGSPARLQPATLNGSGDIRLGMQSGWLALHAAGSGDLEAGAIVNCYPFLSYT